MSDIVYSSHGWPMLAPGARLNQTDDYTRELAAKLETSDAQAAAASAAAAAASAASIGFKFATGTEEISLNVAAGDVANGGVITFPAGRFTSPPFVVVSSTAVATSDHRKLVPQANEVTTTGATIFVGNPTSSPIVGVYIVGWIAIQPS